MSTFHDVLAELQNHFPQAQILESVRPPNAGSEGVRWAGIRFAPDDTSYVGVTREAEDHPQDLVRQLQGSIRDIGPNRRAVVCLTDRSDEEHYRS